MQTRWIERSPAQLAFADGKDLIRQRIRSALRPVNNRIMTMWSKMFNAAYTPDGGYTTLTSVEAVDRMVLVATVQQYGNDDMLAALLKSDPSLERYDRLLRTGSEGE